MKTVREIIRDDFPDTRKMVSKVFNEQLYEGHSWVEINDHIVEFCEELIDRVNN